MNKFLSILCPVLILTACAGKPEYQTTRQADIDCLTRSASFEMPRVIVPQFPNRTFNVIDYGADPTSAKFEKIIDGMKNYTPQEIEAALKAAGFSRMEIDHHPTKPWIAVLARK